MSGCIPQPASSLETTVIKDIVQGDITSPDNRADIIIGMNSELSDVTGIGLPFVKKISVAYPIVLGSVLSFQFNSDRQVHMLICHSLGEHGWKGAHRYVRFGLDYLWQTEGSRRYSSVRIGTGRIGKRDRADHAEILSAMAESFLPVTLYLYQPPAQEVIEAVRANEPLRAFRAWHPIHGEERLAA